MTMGTRWTDEEHARFREDLGRIRADQEALGVRIERLRLAMGLPEEPPVGLLSLDLAALVEIADHVESALRLLRRARGAPD